MGAKSLNILNAFGAMCMVVFFGGIGTMVAKRMPDEIAKGAYYDGVLQIPTWPMKFIFGIGILLLVLRLIFTIIENISEFFDKNEIHCKE
jgi:TRAP-type C4-dicarboxylate transport system permease small subunit